MVKNPSNGDPNFLLFRFIDRWEAKMFALKQIRLINLVAVEGTRDIW